MGANIALFNYFYYIYFDMKLHVNEQSICNVYISHIVIVSSTTASVLRYLINCRDGINDIDYFSYMTI